MNKLYDCVINCCACSIGTILILLLLALEFGISIASIVIGSLNINSNCTGITNLPIYLIVSGSIGLLIVPISPKNKENKNENDNNTFLNLLHFSSVGVLIWGAVMLFGVSKPDCDTQLFNYAYAVTVIPFVFFGFIIFAMCCLGVSSCIEQRTQIVRTNNALRNCNETLRNLNQPNHVDETLPIYTTQSYVPPITPNTSNPSNPPNTPNLPNASPPSYSEMYPSLSELKSNSNA
jgi:hypothetical protein